MFKYRSLLRCCLTFTITAAFISISFAQTKRVGNKISRAEFPGRNKNIYSGGRDLYWPWLKTMECN